MYFTGVILSFIKITVYMRELGMTIIMFLSVVPAVFMVVGIIELISERIHKIDRVLPRIRLLRSFGALTLGGIIGICVSVLEIVYELLIIPDVVIVYPAIRCTGGLLCAVFSGLLYKGYHRI